MSKSTVTFDPAATIKLLVTANPKRPGSLAAGRFALYQNGMSVAAYQQAVKAHIAKLGKANEGTKYLNYATADLGFDSHATRQYIEIVPAKSSK